MNTAQWLAAIILSWGGIAALWEWLDDPIDRKYNSGFYVLCAIVYSVVVITLALVILL